MVFIASRKVVEDRDLLQLLEARSVYESTLMCSSSESLDAFDRLTCNVFDRHIQSDRKVLVCPSVCLNYFVSNICLYDFSCPSRIHFSASCLSSIDLFTVYHSVTTKRAHWYAHCVDTTSLLSSGISASWKMLRYRKESTSHASLELTTTLC